MLKNIETREDGFTLIELLIVIVIIGILAAIAIPVFLSQAQNARNASVQSDVRNAASTVAVESATTGFDVAKFTAATATDPAKYNGKALVTSKDNTLVVTAGTGGFVITGENADADTYKATYTSATGKFS